jgi:hypothetical protein
VGNLSFSCELSFTLSFLFSIAPPLLLIYIFTAPTCKATIISLEPCALNADFQHFIPGFNKVSLLYGYPWKKGLSESRLKDKVTLHIILVFTLRPKTFTWGCVSVFDKYLHWPRVSVYVYV